jgi:hypothetical protein
VSRYYPGAALVAWWRVNASRPATMLNVEIGVAFMLGTVLSWMVGLWMGVIL